MSKQACQRALTQKRTLWGWGALELGDLRLLEDGGELRGTLGSDVVEAEPVNKRWSENGQKSGMSSGADTKANTWAAAAHLSEVTALPLSASHSFVMPLAV